MRVKMAIICIIILVSGAVAIAGAGQNERNSKGLKMMEEALKEIGVAETSCTGFYGATFCHDSPSVEEILGIFREAGFASPDLARGYRRDRIRGCLPSGATGVLLLYSEDGGRKSRVGLSVTGQETDAVCKAVSGVSQGLKKYTTGGTSTFTLAGTIYRHSSKADMVSIMECIMGSMGGTMMEEKGDRNSLNVLGSSPYFSSGIDLDGKKINLNLVVKSHHQEDRTKIYAGTPCLSTPY
ncbi:MAG: hypothetical protein GX364_06295 [Firmicutes bacterium]|nr:hypothetical protein [Bacillota bacterium]